MYRLAFLILLAYASVPSYGQTLVDLSVAKKHTEPIIYATHYGVDIRASAPWMVLAGPAVPTSLFAMKGIEDELELSSRQHSAVKQIDADVNKFYEGVFDKMLSGRTGPTELAQDFEEWRKRLDAEISDVLPALKLERLKQLYNRSLIRRFGLGFFLRTRGEEDNITLTPQDRETLRKAARVLVESASAECSVLYRACLRKLYEPLSAEQLIGLGIKDLETTINDAVERSHVALLDVFVAQVEGGDWKASKDAATQVPQGSRRGTVFVANDRGEIMKYKYSFRARVVDYERVAGHERLLKSLMENSNLLAVKLTESQLNEIVKCNEYVTEQLIAIDLYMFKAKNPWIAYEDAIDMQTLLCREVDTRLESILTPDQRAQLQEYEDLDTQTQAGWFTRISSQLEKANLPLSRKQQREIEEGVTNEVSKARTAMVDLGAKVCGLIDGFEDEKTREYFEKSLGVPDRILSGNFAFLIHDLQALSSASGQ